MKDRHEEIIEIMKQIKDITDFTCEYWWPAYVSAANSPMSAMSEIIWGIMESRGRYVRELEIRLKELRDYKPLT